jgi:hypothetical protein
MVKLCLPNPFLFGSSLGSHSNENESWYEFARESPLMTRSEKLCACMCARGVHIVSATILLKVGKYENIWGNTVSTTFYFLEYYVYLPSALFQFSCNTCSRHLTGAWELRKLSFKLSLLNSHATLVLVWPGHENWENSHANSRFSTLMQLLFSFDRGMRIEKTLIQTLASQLSSTLM